MPYFFVFNVSTWNFLRISFLLLHFGIDKNQRPTLWIILILNDCIIIRNDIEYPKTAKLKRKTILLFEIEMLFSFHINRRKCKCYKLILIGNKYPLRKGNLKPKGVKERLKIHYYLSYRDKNWKKLLKRQLFKFKVTSSISSGEEI